MGIGKGLPRPHSAGYRCKPRRRFGSNEVNMMDMEEPFAGQQDLATLRMVTAQLMDEAVDGMSVGAVKRAYGELLGLEDLPRTVNLTTRPASAKFGSKRPPIIMKSSSSS